MLAIIIEKRPSSELRIEKAKDGDMDDGCRCGRMPLPCSITLGASDVTMAIYTCPYCYTPFNTASRAKECRNTCFNLRQTNSEISRVNKIFKYTGKTDYFKDRSVFGRILHTSDTHFALCGVVKDGHFVGPVQLRNIDVQDDIISL